MCPHKTFANGASIHRQLRQRCGRIYSTGVIAALACLENQTVWPVKQVLKNAAILINRLSISWRRWMHVVFKLGFVIRCHTTYVLSVQITFLLRFNWSYSPRLARRLQRNVWHSKWGYINLPECHLSARTSAQSKGGSRYSEETWRWI